MECSLSRDPQREAWCRPCLSCTVRGLCSPSLSGSSPPLSLYLKGPSLQILVFFLDLSHICTSHSNLTSKATQPRFQLFSPKPQQWPLKRLSSCHAPTPRCHGTRPSSHSPAPTNLALTIFPALLVSVPYSLFSFFLSCHLSQATSFPSPSIPAQRPSQPRSYSQATSWPVTVLCTSSSVRSFSNLILLLNLPCTCDLSVEL